MSEDDVSDIEREVLQKECAKSSVGFVVIKGGERRPSTPSRRTKKKTQLTPKSQKTRFKINLDKVGFAPKKFSFRSDEERFVNSNTQMMYEYN